MKDIPSLSFDGFKRKKEMDFSMDVKTERMRKPNVQLDEVNQLSKRLNSNQMKLKIIAHILKNSNVSELKFHEDYYNSNNDLHDPILCEDVTSGEYVFYSSSCGKHLRLVSRDTFEHYEWCPMENTQEKIIIYGSEEYKKRNFDIDDNWDGEFVHFKDRNVGVYVDLLKNENGELRYNMIKKPKIYDLRKTKLPGVQIPPEASKIYIYNNDDGTYLIHLKDSDRKVLSTIKATDLREFYYDYYKKDFSIHILDGVQEINNESITIKNEDPQIVKEEHEKKIERQFDRIWFGSSAACGIVIGFLIGGPIGAVVGGISLPCLAYLGKKING